MGRRTHESIGKPLPGRLNVIVSSRPAPVGWPVAGAVWTLSLDEAVRVAHERDPDAFVIGGAVVYRALWPRIERVHLTEVHASYPDADVRFAFDRSRWQEISRRPDDGFTHVLLERTSPEASP